MKNKIILSLLCCIILLSITVGCDKSNNDTNNFITTNSTKTLKSILEGKNFSILGDSISTYIGYSNDALNTNDTIGNNKVYYKGSNSGITSVEQTWWKQVANETGMNILVNNSYSGDRITTRGIYRAMQLHDNTGDNKDTYPDIIAVYMGINDIRYAVTVNDFETKYKAMINNIKSNYKEAEIFVFTHIPFYYNRGLIKEGNDEIIEEYNNVIRNIAKNTDKCNLVDYYITSGINFNNYMEFIGDVGLHPNAAGMNKIKESFIIALSDKYLKQQ